MVSVKCQAKEESESGADPQAKHSHARTKSPGFPRRRSPTAATRVFHGHGASRGGPVPCTLPCPLPDPSHRINGAQNQLLFSTANVTRFLFPPGGERNKTAEPDRRPNQIAMW